MSENFNPDIQLDTCQEEENKTVIAAKYDEGEPPFDEEELRKTSFQGHGEKIMKEVQLETINSKLDELLRRTESGSKEDLEPDLKTWIVQYKDITGEPKTAIITSSMDKDDIQRLYRNSGYEVWSVT